MKKHIVMISVLCVIALALGYWSGQGKEEVASSGDVKSSGKKEMTLGYQVRTWKPSSETAVNSTKPGTLLWEFETGGWVGYSPAIGPDGTIYVGSHDTKIYALDGKTGARKWEFKTGNYVSNGPAIGADGTVYFGSVDKKVYALDGAT